MRSNNISTSQYFCYDPIIVYLFAVTVHVFARGYNRNMTILLIPKYSNKFEINLKMFEILSSALGNKLLAKNARTLVLVYHPN